MTGQAVTLDRLLALVNHRGEQAQWALRVFFVLVFFLHRLRLNNTNSVEEKSRCTGGGDVAKWRPGPD